jgi:hypothetical protein
VACAARKVVEPPRVWTGGRRWLGNQGDCIVNAGAGGCVAGRRIRTRVVGWTQMPGVVHPLVGDQNAQVTISTTVPGNCSTVIVALVKATSVGPHIGVSKSRTCGPNQYSLVIHIQERSRSPATRSCKDPGTPSAAESDTWPCLVDARGSRTGGGREWQPCAVVRRVVPGFAWARGLDQVAMVGLEWVDWFNHRRLHSAVRDVPPAEYG